MICLLTVIQWLYQCGRCICLQVEVAQDLRGILIRIGRFKSMELHYTKVHLKPIKQLWEDFDLKQPPSNKLATDKTSNEIQSATSSILFSTWLPNFYDELLLYLEQEWKWYYSQHLIHTFSSLCMLSFLLG